MFERKSFLFIPLLILLTACHSGNSKPQENAQEPEISKTQENTQEEHSTPRPPVVTRPPVITTQPSPLSMRHEVTNWKLSYSAKCATLTPDKCVGAYRFSLTHDGKFQVGPAPEGETLVGFLDDRELKAVRTLLDGFFKRRNQGVDSIEKCMSATSSNGDNSITLSFERYQKDILRQTSTQLCFTDLNADEAQSLMERVGSAVSKYYPAQFPNPCIQAATVFEKDYQFIKACEKDDDCTYVDDFYVPANPSIEDSITTDDCSIIPSLVVANRFGVISNQRKLLIERELARKICGNDLMRSGCQSSKLVSPTAGLPLCINKLCQINPEARAQ